ncbi:hypothetical protein PHYSODRAFT_490851, partial [Phytophthora sojae]
KTPLAAVLRQNTRWSSTFSLLKRYFRLRPFILADDEELSDFLPSRSAHRKLETLLASLRDVESVSKHLQDGLTLLDARVLFDELLESHPSFAKYLVRTRKRRKVAAAPATYELLNAIPPTSNVVERLFSIARAVLRHERHRLSPMMLEMILFLKINSLYWDVAIVEQCL